MSFDMYLTDSHAEERQFGQNKTKFGQSINCINQENFSDLNKNV